MPCNSIFPGGPLPAPAQEIASRFCTENVNSPDYDKIRDLEVFNFYDQLLVRRNVEYVENKGKNQVPCCYEVTNRGGHPVFKVVQTLDETPLDQLSAGQKLPFKLSIFDLRTGNEIIKAVAKQGADSVVVFAKQKHFEYHGIGKVLRVHAGNPLRGPDYNIRGSSGKVSIKIHGGCCLMYKKACFDVCTADDSQCYGKIYKEAEVDPREHRREDVVESQRHVYKLRFPMDISMVSKALILTSALVMDYDYFDSGNREMKTDFFLMTVGLVVITLIVVLLIVLISMSMSNRAAYYSKSNLTRNELDLQYEILKPTQALPAQTRIK